MKNFLSFFSTIKLNTIAGSLSFFFLLCIVPLLLIISFVLAQFSELTGIESSYTLSAFDYTAISIVCLFSTIFSISKLFTQLRIAGETIYNSRKNTTKGIKGIIKSIIFVLLFVFISSICFIFYSLVNILIIDFNPFLKHLLNIILLLIIIAALMYLINYIACPKKIKLFRFTKGVLISTIACIVITYIYFSILNHSNLEHLYGYFAIVVILLSYLYLIIRIILFGLIINAYKLKKQ